MGRVLLQNYEAKVEIKTKKITFGIQPPVGELTSSLCSALFSSVLNIVVFLETRLAQWS